MTTKKIIALTLFVSFFLNNTVFGCEADSSDRGSSKTPPPPILLPRQTSHRQLTELTSPVNPDLDFAQFITTAEPETRAKEALDLIQYLQEKKELSAKEKISALIDMLPKWRTALCPDIKWPTPEQKENLFNLLETNFPGWRMVRRVDSINWADIDWT